MSKPTDVQSTQSDNLKRDIERVFDDIYFRGQTAGPNDKELADGCNDAFREILKLVEKAEQEARVNELGRAEPWLLKQMGESQYFKDRLSELREKK